MENPPVSPEQVRKRVVLFYTTGPFAGLARIVGLLEGPARDVAAAILPSFDSGEGQNVTRMQHWKTLPRAIWYREWTLEAAGRLNDFHPVQV
jgi:hypothetical protein